MENFKEAGRKYLRLLLNGGGGALEMDAKNSFKNAAILALKKWRYKVCWDTAYRINFVKLSLAFGEQLERCNWTACESAALMQLLGQPDSNNDLGWLQVDRPLDGDKEKALQELELMDPDGVAEAARLIQSILQEIEVDLSGISKAQISEAQSKFNRQICNVDISGILERIEDFETHTESLHYAHHETWECISEDELQSALRKILREVAFTLQALR